MVHKLIVLRHGESVWNNQNRFAGWIDIPLSDKGKLEAHYASHLIRETGVRPTKLYTSKLTRAIQTGNLILEDLDMLYVDHDKRWELNERHYGSFQGRDRQAVYQEIGQAQYDYIRRNFEGKPPPIAGADSSIDERYRHVEHLPNGESIRDVSERVLPYLQSVVIPDLIANNEVCLIVTHGSIVRNLMKWLRKLEDPDLKMEIPTGVPIVFELDDGGNLITDYYLDKDLAHTSIKRYEALTRGGRREKM